MTDTAHTFTAGERVALLSAFGVIHSLARIDRITPSGQIVIGTAKYRPDGREIGALSRWGGKRVAPLTPELKRTWWRTRAIACIRSLTDSQCAAFSDDQIRTIMNVIAAPDANQDDQGDDGNDGAAP